MARLAFYIDGFNMYHALDGLAQAHLKWMSAQKLAESFMAEGDQLTKVYFFTAVLTWEREKQARHKEYIAALRATGCEVIESNFAKVRKHCRPMNRYCQRHEEKQTDVAIATTLIEDGLADLYDTAYLVTADSDQIPTAKAFRRLFPQKRLILATPPGRDGEARELGDHAHAVKPIKEGRLRGCTLPYEVTDTHGRVVARVPAPYRRP